MDRLDRSHQQVDSSIEDGKTPIASSTPSDDNLRAWITARLADGASRVTGARAYSSAVFRYDYGAGSLAIKAPVGGVWQRFLLRRELRTYKALRGVDGLVRCHQLLDGKWLVLDWHEGTPFRFAELDDRDVFFKRLRKIIDQMHRRGVAHGDLKKKENLLVGSNDQPVVLDLGTAVMRGRGLGLVLFAWLKRVDNNAWLKLKYASDFSNISAQDRQYYRPTVLERLGRRLRTPDHLPEGRQRQQPTISAAGDPASAETSTRLHKRSSSKSTQGDG